jgi:hypothetical protein
MSSLLPKSWQAKSWRGYSAPPARVNNVQVTSSTISSPNLSPTHSVAPSVASARTSLVLRRVNAIASCAWMFYTI